MAHQDPFEKKIRALQRALLALTALLATASFLTLGIVGLQLKWFSPVSSIK